MDLRRPPSGEELTALGVLTGEGFSAVKGVHSSQQYGGLSLTNSTQQLVDPLTVNIPDAEALAQTYCLVSWTADGTVDADGVGLITAEVQVPSGAPSFNIMYTHALRASPYDLVPTAYAFSGGRAILKSSTGLVYGPSLEVGDNLFRLSASCSTSGGSTGSIAAEHAQLTVVVVQGGCVFERITS